MFSKKYKSGFNRTKVNHNYVNNLLKKGLLLIYTVFKPASISMHAKWNTEFYVNLIKIGEECSILIILHDNGNKNSPFNINV